MKWKDANGNDLSTTKVLDLSSASGSGTVNTDSGSAGSINPSTTGSSTTTSGGSSRIQGPGQSTNLFSGSRGGGISSFYPVIAGGIILVVGIVLWKKRKWLSSKLKRQ